MGAVHMRKFVASAFVVIGLVALGLFILAIEMGNLGMMQLTGMSCVVGILLSFIVY